MNSVPIYDVHLFSDFFTNIDEVITDVLTGASSGLIEYIMPIAWISLAILALVWAGAIWHGHGSSVKDWFTKFAKFVFILQFASVFYVAWVMTPMLHIPDELSAALAKGQTAGAITSSSPADQLVGALEQLVLGTLQAAVDAFKSWNIGGAMSLFSACVLMIIAGVLLLVSVVFNMLYAKIGMSYVLAVGPLFIFFLALGVRNWFTGWLNTAFYFVMLNVLSTLSMLLFTGIANKFMQKLTAAIQSSQTAQGAVSQSLYSMLSNAMSGQSSQASNIGGAVGNAVAAQLNIVSIALQMILIFIPMFLVALETRTLVGSLTGGSGGSFGSGVANVVSTAWRGGWGRHSGGGGGGGSGNGGAE